MCAGCPPVQQSSFMFTICPFGVLKTIQKGCPQKENSPICHHVIRRIRHCSLENSPPTPRATPRNQHKSSLSGLLVFLRKNEGSRLTQDVLSSPLAAGAEKIRLRQKTKKRRKNVGFVGTPSFHPWFQALHHRVLHLRLPSIGFGATSDPSELGPPARRQTPR